MVGVMLTFISIYAITMSHDYLKRDITSSVVPIGT